MFRFWMKTSPVTIMSTAQVTQKRKCQVFVAKVTVRPPLYKHQFSFFITHARTRWSVSLTAESPSHKTASHCKVAMAICALRKFQYRQKKNGLSNTQRK